MDVGLKCGFQPPSPALPLEAWEVMVASRQAPTSYSLCRDHGPSCKATGCLQLDTETEGAYLFCKSQGFACSKTLQKGGNKIPCPTPASLPAPEVKGRLGGPNSALPAEGQGGLWEGGKGGTNITPVAASFGEHRASRKQPSPTEIQARSSAQDPFGCSVVPLPPGSPREPQGGLRGHLC